MKWTLTLLAVAAAVAAAVILLGGRSDDGDDRGAGRAPAPPPLPPAATPPPPSAGFEVALQDDPVFVRRHYYDRERAFEDVRRLGVTWVRMNVLWGRTSGRSRTERTPPARPRYDFVSYDLAVAAARRHGLRVELTLTGPAPAWATADGRYGHLRPDARAFGHFAGVVARHFRRTVARYSIWNEPNFDEFLTPLSESPAIYRRLYERALPAIKRVNPRAQVLIGETAPYGIRGRVMPPLAFLRAVACARSDYAPARRCPELRADGYAHHPYQFETPPERTEPGADTAQIGSLDRLTSALDRLAGAGLLATPSGAPLPVYLTEFGYFRRGGRALSEARRADYLPRAYAVAARRYPRVRQLLQYQLASPPAGYFGSHFNTGLIGREGARTPAFGALRAWAAREA
ncbi:MAG TPA: hypothetical protein VJT75_10600, partial [Thermoleophilaceae bacterium]|nr:hypothetical protein [Thermoleophilaceae bacterium]